MAELSIYNTCEIFKLLPFKFPWMIFNAAPMSTLVVSNWKLENEKRKNKTIRNVKQ